ncbi:MAG TPA: glucose-6-phosphate isomerase, partial [Sphingomonas sp.]|nr:glucose-6-phosphate isomerase [Sphingomonas sp.]
MAWPVERERHSLTDLFSADSQRLSRLTLEAAGLYFDWSKTHLTEDLIDQFVRVTGERDLAGAREALFQGRIVNPSEGRPAEHTAERGEGAPDSVARARAFHNRMRALIDAIEAGALGEIRHVLHVGIGGSALGPDLLIDALGREADRYEVAIVSNVDGAAIEEAMRRFDPETTLLVVASKTFTTTETMLNAASALSWMVEAGVEDPYGRVVALTA